MSAHVRFINRYVQYKVDRNIYFLSKIMVSDFNNENNNNCLIITYRLVAPSHAISVSDMYLTF